MSFLRRRQFWLPGVLIALTSSLLLGQSYQGGIRGAVADGSGAAVSGAKVTLTDQSTSVSRSTVTSSAGEYAFSAVPPATYVIDVENPGFKKFERRNVVVNTQEFLTVDVKMELGAVSESVMVTEEVPLIESTNASTGQVIDNQKLVDLPNLGRNPFLMSKLSQNVTPVGDPRFNRMQDQSGSSQITIAGGPVRGNNYLLDGVPITDFNNRAIIIPSIESVQEVKVQANTYDAEMGRTGGGVFNTFMRSGGNALHGSGFGYTRQPDWLANPFFFNSNPANAGLKPDTPFYNYGFSIGGPILIPKVYNGKNKTFFWVAGEAYRQKSSDVSLFAFPTLAERSGDFSQSRTASGAAVSIYDPLSTDANGQRTPFANGIIPANRLNAVGLAMAKYLPLPQTAPAYFGANDYTGSTILSDRADQLTGKFDQEIRSWWRANLSYLHYGSREPGSNYYNSSLTPGAYLLFRKVDSTQINNVLTPSPTTVISVRWGFNRFPNRTTYPSYGFDNTALGLPSSLTSQYQVPFFPNVTLTGFSGIGHNSASQTSYYSRNFLVGASKFLGRHSLKAGFDYRTIHEDGIAYSNPSGTFSFDDTFSRQNYATTNGTGNSLASLLLGYPTSGSVGTATNLFDYVHYYAFYVHDDFRVSSKLTLNIGLRYEYEPGLSEKNNALVVGFDYNATNPLAASTGLPLKGGLEYAGVNGYPTHCCNFGSKVSPRFGFAYAWNNKTTIRGGYGIFWAPQRYELFNPLGYTQQTPYVASNNGNQTPANSLSNPFPTGLLQPVGNTLGLIAGIGNTVTYYSQDAKAPRVQQFSLDVQRELPWGIALTVGYVGSHSTHLAPSSTSDAAVNINQLNPAFFGQSGLLTGVANPFYQKGGAGSVAGTLVAANQLLRPYPQFAAVSMVFNDYNHARYDAFVIKAQKRFAQGLTFLATYTHSRNMDASFGSGNFFQSFTAAPQNAYDLAAEYSRSIVDTPNRFASSVTYELPFGKGRRYLNRHRALDLALGGWSINAVTLFQTGYPLAITQAANNNSPYGAGVQRPSATGVSPEVTGTVEERLTGYINPAAFSISPVGTFGNLSRTIEYRGPGMGNWDTSLFKTFSVVERVKAQFRAEAINTFNTPMFNGPDTSFGPTNPNFGKITRQANFPRYLQLGVRFMF